MRSFFIALAAAGLISGGCGGAADTGGATPRNRSAKRREAPRADYEDENSVGMSQRRVSRWRWKGARKDCFYVVGNKCFRTEKAACRAAGCSERADCELDDGAPREVSCPTAKRGKKRRRR